MVRGCTEPRARPEFDVRVGCIQPTTWLDGLREQPPPCLSDHEHLVRLAVHPVSNDGAIRSRWLWRQVIEQTAEAIFGCTPTEHVAGPVVELGGDGIEMLATVCHIRASRRLPLGSPKALGPYVVHESRTACSGEGTERERIARKTATLPGLLL